MQELSLSRADRLRLLLRWGYHSSDVDVYGFNDGRPLQDAARYLGYDWYMSHVRPVLNARWAKPLTESKWVFYRLADALGLPTPRTFGLFDSTYGVSWDGQRRLQTVSQVPEEMAERRPGGLVLKPVGGRQGKQLLILDAIDHSTGVAVTREGAGTTLEAALTPTGTSSSCTPTASSPIRSSVASSRIWECRCPTEQRAEFPATPFREQAGASRVTFVKGSTGARDVAVVPARSDAPGMTSTRGPGREPGDDDYSPPPS